MGELNLGVVGLGGISQSAHGPAISRSRAGLKMTACCDLRAQAVKSWQDQYGGAGYADMGEMLGKEKLDAVLLVTWPNQHREQIEQILAAGVKNILCEKALTLSGKEAVEIFDMVTAAGAFVMEGFMYRHNPVIHRIEQILARGELGPVDNVRACFSCFDPETADPSDPNRDWRQRKECGGGIPYDFACYCVNCCGHFAGALPTRIHAIGGKGVFDTINRVYGTIEYDNGVVGIIESSKKSSFTQEVQLSCAHGILNVPIAWTIDRNLTITQRDTGWNNTAYDTVVSDGVTDGVTSYQLQAENFAAAVRGESRPLIPLAQSVVNTFALEALATGIEEDRRVDISIPEHIVEAYRRDVTPPSRVG